MTVAGATGPAQIGGAGLPSALPALSQLSQTELEFLAGRQQSERRSARLGSPAKADPNAKTITGIPAASNNSGSHAPAARSEADPEPMAAAAMLGDTIPPPQGASAVTAPDPWEFIQRVLAWPQGDEPGYCNLHFLPPEDPTQPNKKGGMRGRAFRDLSEFMGFAQWCTANPGAVAHTYFCLSTQLHPGKAHKGKLTASRSAQFALKLKSAWLDVDVKPDPKCYGSLADALAGVEAFIVAAGLPPPSALVFSGSGLHVYWISNRPLTVAEWRPYAEGLKAEAIKHGLKCDAGLTTDCARVLRIPGTTNGKTTPPKPVILKHLGVDYDFAIALAGLAQVGAAAAATAAGPTIKAASPFDLSAFAGKRPAQAFAPLNPTADKLSDGINTHDDRPLNPDQIVLKCPHFRDAANTHGAGYPQGLWMLDVLACTFFENGRRWAHALSKGYGTYSDSDTDAMYDRKEADKARGIGWPSCQAFEHQGCKSCAVCPWKHKIRSPLNLAERERAAEAQQARQAGADQNNAGTQASASAPIVPAEDHMKRARIYRKERRSSLLHYRDDFYDHEAGRYVTTDDTTIKAEIYEFFDKCNKEVVQRDGTKKTVPFQPNKNNTSETIEALKAVCHVLPRIEQPHWLDGRSGPDPADLICFPNGILDLTTNAFTGPDHGLFTSHGLAFNYDPTAPAPTEWLKFLNQIFDGEQDQIDALQEMFGYCMSSDLSQEKGFMIVGEKRSGKDTLRRALECLLSAVCGPTLDSMGNDFGMSQLIGKQLAIVGDMRLGSKCDKDLLAENILKLTGRGLFTINRKYKEHWTGMLLCKLLLISNEMPKLKDTSGALPSRLITFKTRVSFYGREDRNLFRDKIKPELPGIMLWALKGLRRMRARGPIAEPVCSVEAREELAREASPVLAFVEECLTLDPRAVINKDNLYSAYRNYAEQNGLHPLSRSWFFRDLETATAGKLTSERVRKGASTHNIIGARISKPPSGGAGHPTAPTVSQAEDVGEPDDADQALDTQIKAPGPLAADERVIRVVRQVGHADLAQAERSTR